MPSGNGNSSLSFHSSTNPKQRVRKGYILNAKLFCPMWILLTAQEFSSCTNPDKERTAVKKILFEPINAAKTITTIHLLVTFAFCYFPQRAQSSLHMTRCCPSIPGGLKLLMFIQILHAFSPLKTLQTTIRLKALSEDLS